jgi:hypothetical protein
LSKTYPTLQEVLEKLTGAPLSSVDFVEDYVQLVWSDSTLNAYTMPSIVAMGREYRLDDREYRPMMYRLKGRPLEKVEVTDEAVNLRFAGETVVSISLRDDDYVGPEALWYSQRDGLSYVA